MNAPHNWQLGWANPIGELGAAMSTGVWNTFAVPRQMATPDNFIRISTTWDPLRPTQRCGLVEGGVGGRGTA